MSAAMTAQLVTDALVMAIWRWGKSDALLHHTAFPVIPGDGDVAVPCRYSGDGLFDERAACSTGGA
jgi:hypothetical protein